MCVCFVLFNVRETGLAREGIHEQEMQVALTDSVCLYLAAYFFCVYVRFACVFFLFSISGGQA